MGKTIKDFPGYLRKLDLRRWAPWILAFAMFLIYASHPTRKFYFDGVVFASIIEHGPNEHLFNPHHLLYTWIFKILHDFLEGTLKQNIQALFLMQWANIIVGSLAVTVIWRLLSKLFSDSGFVLLLILLGCFSFTYWHYTTDANVYIISMLFLLLAADRFFEVIHHGEPKDRDFIIIGLLNAASVLFHQLNIFWISCVAGSLIFGIIPGTKSIRWRYWWIYFSSLAVPVAAAYLVVGVYILDNRTIQSFVFWTTRYGHEPSYWISDWKDIPLSTLNGYLMVFFHRPSITPNIMDYDLGLAMEEGRFWKGFLKKVFGYYSLGFLFFCYLSALYNVKKYVLQFRKQSIPVFWWLAPYVLFQFFFMPTNYFYKLFTFVPILAVFSWYASVDISREKRWFKLIVFGVFIIYTSVSEPVLGILVAIFAGVFEIFRNRKAFIYRWGIFILTAFLPLYNYIAGIYPESMLETNPEVKAAIDLQDDFHEGDLLIFEGGYDYPNGWIISALTPAKVLTLTSLHSVPDKGEKIINDTIKSGGRVFIHPNITENGQILSKSAEKLGVSVDALISPLSMFEIVEGFSEKGKKYDQIISFRMPG